MSEHPELVQFLCRLCLVVAGKVEMADDNALQAGVDVQEGLVERVVGLLMKGGSKRIPEVECDGDDVEVGICCTSCYCFYQGQKVVGMSGDEVLVTLSSLA